MPMVVSAASTARAVPPPANERFSAQLRGLGIRPTAIRLSVLQTLAESESEWLRCDEVFLRMLKRGTTTGLASVYRVIRELEKANLVQSQWERSVGGARAVHRLQPAGLHKARFSL